MNPETQCYMDIIQALHKEAKQSLQGLPAEAVNWKPSLKDANSIAALVVHMTGSEAFLVYQGLTGADVGRVRDQEFKTVAQSAEQLIATIDRAEARTRETLDKASPSSLNEKSLLKDRDVTRRWCVIHTIDHLGIHTGHLHITRQLWEEKRAALSR